MEINLEKFRQLFEDGIATKTQYGNTITIPNDIFKKGDFVVVMNGENAGSFGHLSYISGDRITFPEDETHTPYEVENKGSVTFLEKVGDPKTYGWDITSENDLKRISITINGVEISNMGDLELLTKDLIAEAILPLNFKNPFNLEIKHNVEMLIEEEA